MSDVAWVAPRWFVDVSLYLDMIMDKCLVLALSPFRRSDAATYLAITYKRRQFTS